MTPLNPDALTAGPAMDREIHVRVLGESLTYPHWILSTQEGDCSLFFGKTKEAVEEHLANQPPDSGTMRVLNGRTPRISNLVMVPPYSTDTEMALELLYSRWTTPKSTFIHVNGSKDYLRSWSIAWLPRHGLFHCVLTEGGEEVGKGAGKTVPEAACKALLQEADGL